MKNLLSLSLEEHLHSKVLLYHLCIWGRDLVIKQHLSTTAPSETLIESPLFSANVSLHGGNHQVISDPTYS